MYILTISLIVDLIIGDPSFYPHPVVLIGSLINYLEKLLLNKQDNDYIKKVKGVLLVITVLLITFFITYFLIYLFKQRRNY
jgi:adenosylcobinamide-phosphate synthase